ncbi:PDT-domain-containing protein [Marasmius fiardii PR-910]|nr:PDT-domain-containing protein [Marasmius fiardii PR-910]
MNGSNSVKHKPKVAFLGPLGTYSHQAAYEQFHDTADYVERKKISDVLNVLGEVDFGVIPQENTIFGPVVETYDGLRNVESGFIRGEVTLQVRHCLVVRAGVKISDIDCVMSHEQALGQCSGFLAKHLPQASTMKMTSTAAAAEAISKSPGSTHAAICSKMCLKMFEGLELLREGIQDENSNYTRFYVMAKDVRTVLLVVSLRARALLRTYCTVGTTAERNAVDIANIIKALEIPIARIDRRPAHDGKPFNDVYFIELRDSSYHPENKATGWDEQVDRAMDRVRATGAEVTLLGLW